MTVNTDKTPSPLTPPAIHVRIERGVTETTEFSFSQPFRVGRDQTCEIQLADPQVSRFHAEFWHTDGKWWVLDLGS